MAQLEAKTSVEADRLVVSLAGECDLSARDRLTSLLLGAVGQAPVVVVDLSELSFMDSSGIHGLVTAHQAARRDGGHLYVVHAVGVVAEVLELTGVGALLSPPPNGGDPLLARPVGDPSDG